METHIADFFVEKKADRCGIIIFGASGDLTHRKLLPALFSLYRDGKLPECFYILGCARTSKDDDLFRTEVSKAIKEKCEMAASSCQPFVKRCYYESGDYADPDLYARLSKRLASLDQAHDTSGNHLFYFSTPPGVYSKAVDHLDEAGLVPRTGEQSAWSRVIFEKPYGYDQGTALELDASVHRHLDEKQIYRIDHYLGKETVQNILVLRFMNSVFEPVWNRRYIDHIQITVAEKLGVGRRGGYYEQVGVLPDMFQNHMLQLLSLIGMEPPTSFDADIIQDEKVKLIRSIRPIDEHIQDDVVLGQYAGGVIDNQHVPAYREEEGVHPKSCVATYAAMKLMVDNWRWQGVPFYLRCGKRLSQRRSEIAIYFKKPPHSMFNPKDPEQAQPNVLLINIQPEESFSLTLEAKRPGSKVCTAPVTMEFNYKDAFGGELPEAYERLLLDAMRGDQTLYIRNDLMESSWALFTPVVNALRQPDASEPDLYESGNWGPEAANHLLEKSGRVWRDLGVQTSEIVCQYVHPDYQ